MKSGKVPVKFVFSDDVSETTITIQADDTSEDIAAKLRRVLELEGEVPPPFPVAFVPPAVPIRTKEELGPLFDAAGAEAELTGRTASGNGWASSDIEKLPEM